MQPQDRDSSCPRHARSKRPDSRRRPARPQAAVAAHDAGHRRPVRHRHHVAERGHVPPHHADAGADPARPRHALDHQHRGAPAGRGRVGPARFHPHRRPRLPGALRRGLEGHRRAAQAPGRQRAARHERERSDAGLPPPAVAKDRRDGTDGATAPGRAGRGGEFRHDLERGAGADARVSVAGRCAAGASRRGGCRQPRRAVSAAERVAVRAGCRRSGSVLCFLSVRQPDAHAARDRCAPKTVA